MEAILERPLGPSVWGHASECRDRVLVAVCDYYDLAPDLVLGRDRAWPLDDARGVLMYVMSLDCALSSREIARVVGRTTSVVEARLRAMPGRERVDRATREAVGGVRARLGHDRRKRPAWASINRAGVPSRVPVAPGGRRSV